VCGDVMAYRLLCARSAALGLLGWAPSMRVALASLAVLSGNALFSLILQSISLMLNLCVPSCLCPARAAKHCWVQLDGFPLCNIKVSCIA
jgi:hypothetical protein